MGVTQLWQILAPVAEHRPLTALRGQTLAVDLSIWVCETQCVKQMQGIVSKPFLRNLFFRIVHLSQLGVRLVFVIEGSAPEIKWETMMKRQQTRFPGRQGKAGGGSKPAGSQNRRNFNACLKECCELLDILGIPYVQSKGEAEAMCALLNSAGLVDGCLTNDGDAFLYGATTVYRNFTMNAKDPHVEMYRTSDIEGKLGIDRGGLVALGLLIGCDFVPKGVPGIGLANAVKLLQSLKGTDVLERLKQWRSMPESSCLAQIEVATRRKALDLSDFPQMKVINEFMIPKDRCPSRLSPWKRPVPAKLQEFALLKLEWPAEYTLEKVLPLTTLWDMQDILQSTNPSCHQHLKPHRIVKTRVRQGEPCFEVEWSKPVTDTLTEGSTYVTVECQDIFSRCYPHIVECFVGETESKNKAKGKKKKKKKKEASTDVDNLSFNFHKMNLAEVTNKLAQTVKDLPTEFDTYSECNLVTKAKQPKHLTLESVSMKPASGPKATSAKRSESDQDKVKSIFNFDKKSAEAVTKPTKSPVETLTTSEGGYVPLSERVKLRMQNKAVPCVNPNTSQLSDMSSLLEEVENLSLIESKLKCSTSSMSSNSKVNTKFPLHFTPVTAPVKAANLHTLQTREMSSVAQKMSSPFSANICSPMSFIRQSLTAGGQSPIPKSSPSVNGSSYATDSPSQLTPNVHKPFAEKCTAEKIAARLESGIMNVGKPQKNDWKNFSFFDKGETLPKCATSTAKTPVALSVKDTVKTPKLGNQSLLDYSSLGLDASQFGNFEIQTSLLNSLCSSLIQALTPKGVTMSKEEYENLMSTLKEIEKEDEIPKNIEEDGPEVDDLACAIDFSAIEKASSELKKMKTGIVLDPIRLVGDAQVVENVEARSKSARKKLRRKEKHRALEDIAHLNNMSQRILNNQGHETQSKQGKVVEIGKDRSSSLSAQKMESTASRTKSNSCDGNRKLSINDVDLRKTEQDKCKNTTCSNVNDGSTRNVSSNGSSKKKNNLLTDRNTSKCKLEAQTVTSCSENKTVPPKSQAVRPSTTDNAKKCAAENDSCKSGSQTQKVETIKRETADSKEKQKAKSAGKEPLKPAGKPCSTSYSCHKAHNSPESASESSSRPNIGKPGLVMEPLQSVNHHVP